MTLPLCVFTTGCPPPPNAQGLDKPWLAIDETHGRFRGSAYLVWVHDYADGRHQLRFSVSHDRGRTYSAPLVLDRSTAARLDGLEELAQLAVRPDGTVDVVERGSARPTGDTPRGFYGRRRELPHPEAGRLAEARSEPFRDRDDPRRTTFSVAWASAGRRRGRQAVTTRWSRARSPTTMGRGAMRAAFCPGTAHGSISLPRGSRANGSGSPHMSPTRHRHDWWPSARGGIGSRPWHHGEPVAGARVTHLRSPGARLSRHGDVHRRLHRARRDPTAGRHRLTSHHRGIAPSKTGWSSHRFGWGTTTRAFREPPNSDG